MQLRVFGRLPRNVDVSAVLENMKERHREQHWIVSAYAADLGVLDGIDRSAPKSYFARGRLGLGLQRSEWKGEHWMRETLDVFMYDMAC